MPKFGALTDMNLAAGRIVWVDNAKALLIVLVVLGHFETLNGTVKTVLYAFHLPAFLFLTGFMISPSSAAASTVAFFRKNIFPFARLYLFCSLVSLLLWWASKVASPDRFGLLFDAVVGILYGTQWPGHWFLHGNGPLWYLPFLVLALIGFHLAMKLPVLLQGVFVLAYFIFTMAYDGPRLPWSSDAAGVGLFFIYSGYLCRRYFEAKPNLFALPAPRLMLALSAVVSAAGLVLFALLNGGSNIDIMLFGNNPLYYLAAAFLGIYMVIAVCMLVPRSTIAYQLSINSLLIFCVHIYGVKVLERFPHLSSVWAESLLLLLMAFVLAVASAIVSTIIMPWISKVVMRRHQAA